MGTSRRVQFNNRKIKVGENEMSDLSIYREEGYALATRNTVYNSSGQAVITEGDEWRSETEWDGLYSELKRKSEELHRGKGY